MRRLTQLSLLFVVGAVGCKSSSEVGSFAAPEDAGNDAEIESGTGGTGGTLSLPPLDSRLALGSATTCAIDSAEKVQCWGDNYVGQLGIGSETPELTSTPVTLPTIGPGAARALFGGAVAQCMVLFDGHVACWGDSVFAELRGRGAVHAISLSPFDAPGLSSVVSMAVGTYFHCALTTEGGVKCYGLNSSGQLGIGTLDDSFIPADVDSDERFVQLTASQSGFFACAVSVGGAAYCWGSNVSGALGSGKIGDELGPAPVNGLGAGVTAIAAGREHACAIVSAGVRCWGRNDEGQLGIGPGPSEPTPVDVTGMGSIVAITAGVAHTCALDDQGTALCWGSVDSENTPSGPTAVIGSGVLELRAGGDHTCALIDDGTLRCWGANHRGQLGTFYGNGAPL
jgi:alpha-tubulin suppressor-like RCC1 family protein